MKLSKLVKLGGSTVSFAFGEEEPSPSQSLTPGSTAVESWTATAAPADTTTASPRLASAMRSNSFMPSASFAEAPVNATTASTFEVSVVADHPNDIEKVAFIANGGTPVEVTTPTARSWPGQRANMPTTPLYTATLDLSSQTAGVPVEVRAIVYPKQGVCRVLQGNGVNNPEDGSIATQEGTNSIFVTKVSSVNNTNVGNRGLHAAINGADFSSQDVQQQFTLTGTSNNWNDDATTITDLGANPYVPIRVVGGEADRGTSTFDISCPVSGDVASPVTLNPANTGGIFVEYENLTIYMGTTNFLHNEKVGSIIRDCHISKLSELITSFRGVGLTDAPSTIPSPMWDSGTSIEETAVFCSKYNREINSGALINSSATTNHPRDSVSFTQGSRMGNGVYLLESEVSFNQNMGVGVVFQRNVDHHDNLQDVSGGWTGVNILMRNGNSGFKVPFQVSGEDLLWDTATTYSVGDSVLVKPSPSDSVTGWSLWTLLETLVSIDGTLTISTQNATSINYNVTGSSDDITGVSLTTSEIAVTFASEADRDAFALSNADRFNAFSIGTESAEFEPVSNTTYFATDGTVVFKLAGSWVGSDPDFSSWDTNETLRFRRNYVPYDSIPGKSTLDTSDALDAWNRSDPHTDGWQPSVLPMRTEGGGAGEPDEYSVVQNVNLHGFYWDDTAFMQPFICTTWGKSSLPDIIMDGVSFRDWHLEGQQVQDFPTRSRLNTPLFNHVWRDVNYKDPTWKQYFGLLSIEQDGVALATTGRLADNGGRPLEWAIVDSNIGNFTSAETGGNNNESLDAWASNFTATTGSTGNVVVENSDGIYGANSPSGTVTITGQENVGQTLESSNNISDASSISFAWERSADGSTGWTAIAGATSSSYTLQAADENNHVRVVVTADGLPPILVATAQTTGPVSAALVNMGSFTFTFQGGTNTDDGATISYTEVTDGGSKTGVFLAKGRYSDSDSTGSNTFDGTLSNSTGSFRLGPGFSDSGDNTSTGGVFDAPTYAYTGNDKQKTAEWAGSFNGGVLVVVNVVPATGDPFSGSMNLADKIITNGSNPPETPTGGYVNISLNDLGLNTAELFTGDVVTVTTYQT